MTLVLFAVFFVLIALGAPVAIAIGMGCLAGLMSNGTIPLQALSQRITMGLDSFPMLAIPLFILAGDLMNNAGITKRLVRLSKTLVGHIPGALAQVGFLTNIFMATICGSGLASAAATGGILIPEMKKEGYDPAFASAVMSCAATVGPIIPPSVPLVLYATISEVSVGRLFIGGAIPGVLMSVGMMSVTYFVAKKRKYPITHRASLKEVVKALLDALLALLAPAAIIGGILSGWATATESAIIAVWISLIIGTFVYKELNIQKIIASVKSAVLTTGTICFIIACCAPFSWIMAWENIPVKFIALLSGIMHMPWLIMLILMVIILILGMFMDGSSIIVLTTPILLPVIKTLGVDPVHYGVVLAINTMIGSITPPVGTLMYVGNEIAGVNIAQFTREAMRYMIILIVLLFLFTYVPALTTWLPNLLMN